MTQISISEKDGRIYARFGDGGVVAFSPQQLWDTCDEGRSFLVANALQFAPPLVQTVGRNAKSFRVVVGGNSKFWEAYREARWEPHTFRIFDAFLNESTTYLDIGAWIGATVMYAGQVAKKCWAFEPDPIAFAELESNLALNEGQAWAARVKAVRGAVTPDGENVILGSRTGGGDSESSVLFANEETHWKVPGVNLPEFIRREGITGRVFFKIDIEGGEYELIPSLCGMFRDLDCGLYLSLHPSFLLRSLSRASASGYWERLKARWRFFSVHQRLLANLPFRYLYDRRGRNVSRVRLLLGAIRRGNFPTELVAVNREWKASTAKP